MFPPEQSLHEFMARSGADVVFVCTYSGVRSNSPSRTLNVLWSAGAPDALGKLHIEDDAGWQELVQAHRDGSIYQSLTNNIKPSLRGYCEDLGLLFLSSLPLYKGTICIGGVMAGWHRIPTESVEMINALRDCSTRFADYINEVGQIDEVSDAELALALADAAQPSLSFAGIPIGDSKLGLIAIGIDADHQILWMSDSEDRLKHGSNLPTGRSMATLFFDPAFLDFHQARVKEFEDSEATQRRMNSNIPVMIRDADGNAVKFYINSITKVSARSRRGYLSIGVPVIESSTGNVAKSSKTPITDSRLILAEAGLEIADSAATRIRNNLLGWIALGVFVACTGVGIGVVNGKINFGFSSSHPPAKSSPSSK